MAQPISNRLSWWTVSLLSLLFVLSYLDRLILGLMIDPVKTEFGASDAQMGLLIGGAFALVYSVLGLPMGYLADRLNRKWLIVSGVLLWGGMTVLSAFSLSFAMLLVLRVGLAIGEATLSPAALSKISDMFPIERRARPLGIYLASGTFGITASYIFGAAVIQFAAFLSHSTLPVIGGMAPWRLVLLAAGAPTVLLGLVLAVTTREPPRTGLTAAPDWKAVFARFGRDWRLYGGLFFGTGVAGVVSFGMAAWYPSHLIRAFDLSESATGYLFGGVAMAGAVIGGLSAPIIAERWTRRRSDALVVTHVLFLTLGAIGVIGAGLAPTLTASLGAIFFGMVGFAAIGVLPSVATQLVAPSRMRASFVAVYYLCLGLIGLTLGPVVLPLVAGLLTASDHALGQAMALVAAVFGTAGGLLILSSRTAYARARATAADE